MSTTDYLLVPASFLIGSFIAYCYFFIRRRFARAFARKRSAISTPKKTSKIPPVQYEVKTVKVPGYEFVVMRPKRVYLPPPIPKKTIKTVVKGR